MKRTILALLLLVSTLGAKAQLTLQHSYNFAYGLSVVNLLLSGKKYCQYDYTLQQMKLYNLNHTLWRSINVPAIPGLSAPTSPQYVSENFFKIDNLVDFLVPYYDTGSTAGTIFHWVIFDETGAIINRFDSTVQFTIHNVGVDSFVAFIDFKSSPIWVTSVYTLPGTIPCDICGGGGAGLGLGKAGGSDFGAAGVLSEPIPNPSSEQTKIEYKIPHSMTGIIKVFDAVGKELKSYKVDGTFDYITLDNSELASGIYYYSLTTADGESSSKKMVVIR